MKQAITDLDAMLQRFERTDGSNSGYLFPLAYSYLQTDREAEFKQLTDALAESKERRIVANDKSYSSMMSAINLAALTGTDERAKLGLEKYQPALANN